MKTFGRLSAPRLCLLLLLMLVPGCQGAAGPDFSTPEGTMKAVTQAMAEGRPEVFWDSMPASYREDVSDIVHGFAESMNPEAWQRGFGLLAKLATLTREKRDFILNSPMLSAAADADEMRKNWDHGSAALQVLVDSDLGQLDKLKTLDMRQFIAGTGGELMEQLSAMEEGGKSEADQGATLQEKLEGLTVTVVEKSADRAVLTVQSPGDEPTQETYVLVEERWVPESIAADWDQNIAELRTRLTKMSEGSGEIPPQVEAAMSAAESVLDQLAAAETQQDFDQVIQQAMGVAMGLALMLGK